jgi:hypothetical protein
MDALKSWPCKTLLVAGMVLLAATFVGCGPAAEREPTMTMEEACRPVRPKEDPAVARLRRALKKPIDVTFDATPLDQALKVIGEKAGVAIIPDPDLETSGVDLQGRWVTLVVEQVPADEILDVVLDSQDLGYIVRSECLLVTTCGAAQRDLVLVIYPVADLFDPREPQIGWPGWQDLIDIVKRDVNEIVTPHAASYYDGESAAAIDYFGGALVVMQTPRAQHRILSLLTMLRQAKAHEDSGEPVRMPEQGGVNRIRRQLAETIKVEFNNTPLAEALNILRKSLKGVNVMVSPSLQRQGIDLQIRTVTLTWENAPIGEVLDRILGADLGYRICSHYILIGTRGMLEQNLPIVVYPIQDLLLQLRLAGLGSANGILEGALSNSQERKPSDVRTPGSFGNWVFAGNASSMVCQSLANVIKCYASNFADPHVAAWTDEGGPAAIDYYGGVLIVTQTPEGHEQVARLLDMLRQGLTRVERQLQK